MLVLASMLLAVRGHALSINNLKTKIHTAASHKLHAPPSGSFHVEIPARLTTAVAHCDSRSFPILPSSNPLERVTKAINRAHTPDYIAKLKSTVGGLTSDTYIAPNSYLSLLSTTSAWINCVDYALTSEGPSFALCRPPGHHATKGAAMGFCLVNFAAVTALEARGLLADREGVAVLDIDVHFGNGSADILKNVEGVKFASVHQAGIYPGTGDGPSEGFNILKLPVPAACDPSVWLKAVSAALDFLIVESTEVLVVSIGERAKRASFEEDNNDNTSHY